MSEDLEVLFDGPDDARRLLVLAHGSGAPMDSDFMNTIAAGIGERGVRVARFEFPYMRERRATGKRRPPNPAPRLLASWHEALKAIDHPRDHTFVGGKSLGGRIASMIADEAGVAGLVCFGYPFHPPGRPEKLRVDHLRELATPALVVQGERDPFGTRDDVAGYTLAKTIAFEWMPDGDHSFKPRKRSGYDEAENLARAVDAAADFVERA